MESDPASFVISHRFDDLISAIYHKMTVRKVNDSEAYFAKYFYPFIYVEGVITSLGDRCEIEFIAKPNVGINSKVFLVVLAVLILAIAVSELSILSKLGFSSLLAASIIGTIYLMRIVNQNLAKLNSNQLKNWFINTCNSHKI